MPTPILMPALSPTMEEGTLAKWLVQEGDNVNSGDIIAEIETDKATMEVEAVDEGTIGKILINAGTENVKVNELIAVILDDGETAGDIDLTALGDGGAAPLVSNPAETNERAMPAPQALAPAPAALNPAGRIMASPLAKRIAKNEGLDLSLVKGSGPHGRVVKRDVEQALKDGTGKTALVASVGMPAAGIDGRLYPADSYTAVKNDGMRKTIAKRLHQSFNQEVPHFPLNVDIELTALLAAREALNAGSPAKGEPGFYKISVNDFILKASAQALMAVPGANASYTDDAILMHRHADIGVAVAIDGGLITPIIWQAETKGLKQISDEVRDLAGRARTKKLKPEEYMGGTFSVSNLGMFGITSFSSIVNQPHGAIMSVGAGESRAVVRGGQVVARTMMTVTLTCDHRVVDGAVGATFISAFKRFIEEPAAMLL